MGDGRLILVAGALLTAGLVLSLVATRVRLPALLLFLGIGMAIGSDGTGWIDFGAEEGDFEIARTAGVIALALILFEGGLTSGLLEVRPVLPTAISLAVPGTIITALICGLAASWLFDLTTLEGLLLGSILASTDGAATFAVLRASSLRRRIARTLEAESGLNDPVAVLLVIGFIAWIEEPSYGIEDMLLLFAEQLGIGLLVGVAVGWLAVAAFRRARLDSAGLYPVASLATGAVAFGAADTLEGSGFLAVYLAGLALGSASIPAKLTVTAFHQGLAWVAQMGLFFVLGLLVFPSRLPEAALRGTVLALVILFVARPVATFLATQVGRVPLRERAVLSAAGLRGAVPVVLATFPVIEGVPGSRGFFDVVFFAVLLSTVLQAPAIEPLARALGATTAEPALPRPAGRGGDDPPPRRRGARARDPRRRRHRGQPRARPRPAPRRRRQRHRARRRRRSRRAARRSCARAIACTSCCARSRRPRCVPSPTAGRWGRSARRRARGPPWAARPCSRCARCATGSWKERWPARSPWPATAR